MAIDRQKRTQLTFDGKEFPVVKNEHIPFNYERDCTVQLITNEEISTGSVEALYAYSLNLTVEKGGHLNIPSSVHLPYRHLEYSPTQFVAKDGGKISICRTKRSSPATVSMRQDCVLDIIAESGEETPQGEYSEILIEELSVYDLEYLYQHPSEENDSITNANLSTTGNNASKIEIRAVKNPLTLNVQMTSSDDCISLDNVHPETVINLINYPECSDGKGLKINGVTVPSSYAGAVIKLNEDGGFYADGQVGPESNLEAWLAGSMDTFGD